MKTSIFVITSAFLLSIGTLVVGAWASGQSADATCSSMEIQICDSASHQYVDAAELRRSLQRSGLSPLGKQPTEVSCQAIEDHLLQHDMVRTAECYKLSTGDLRIKVTQRIPIMQVRTADGGYYVDTDRKIMPLRSTIDVDVPIFKGDVNKNTATQEYYDFVHWLKNDPYWANRITHIHVHHPEHVVLTQCQVNGKILLGKLDDYEDKMERLRKLYVKGFDKIGYKSYTEYDLRFEGQVIGRY